MDQGIAVFPLVRQLQLVERVFIHGGFLVIRQGQ